MKSSLAQLFLTDDVLQEAYNSVTRGNQKDGEDEAAFATRLSKSSRLCRHVFRKADVVNYFVCGLKPSVREMVAQHVRMMPVADRTNLAAVKQAAVAVGKSQRAMGVSKVDKPGVKSSSSGKLAVRPQRAGKVMMMTPPAYEWDQHEERLPTWVRFSSPGKRCPKTRVPRRKLRKEYIRRC